MSACPHTHACRLARTISAKEALRVWESFYCGGAYHRCERFKLLTAGAVVPDGLLPNGRLLEPVDEPARRH
jgi:hypothetical protein